MTALNQYERLECPGVWRADAEDQRRDVYVSLGDATLVIYDGAERALAHWSLAALSCRNPGKTPALYAPGEDAREELELDSAEMIDAIERVRSAIEKRRPRHGRLRLLLAGAALSALAVFGLYWVPPALIDHAATVVPPAKRADIGDRLLAHIQRLAGRPCTTPSGTAALERLNLRLRDAERGDIVVLSSGSLISGHLPGGTILLSRTLVEDYDTPDVVSGFVIAESLRLAQSDPIKDLLDETGAMTAARLLTTGDVPEPILAGYAETLMTQHAAAPDDQALLAAFRRARVATSPYAYARDMSGETTLALIEADPGSSVPVLPDGAWVSLQGICGE
ncbi:hypothetical protein AIOL_000841 [Candidatus Rhodobacter oscarellae]|uniref:Uncharacterized protein n=1 Tax=Candidatus Rhodobacter oscarellae TaxID=1675527 RepID=A0A0J9ED10_9RHOB|nr:hypothetical protein [Candidatus Rhodobacter lobularis]KMW60677.1 hypothetical protein AIOL_000841 [Candidatus Rhodobacter lobularis]